MKKIMPQFIIIILLSACAAHYREPESIREKMARFKAKEEGINRVPEYYSPTRNLLTQTGRTPASIHKKAKPALNYNNKNLYFLTLYGQYSKLQNYSKSTAPEIKICPNFHTTLLKYKEKYGTQQNKKIPIASKIYDKSKFNDNDFLAVNPELSLPVTSENIHPRVKDILLQKNDQNSHEIILKALDIHLTKTYNEIKELCEHGQSQNYYIFENLMTYIGQQSEFKSSEKNMKYLLKTTVYSNIALIHSMNKFPKKRLRRGPSRGIASMPDQDKGSEVFSNELLNRLNASWSNNYLNSISTPAP